MWDMIYVYAGEEEDMKWNKKAVLLSGLAACLFLAAVIQDCRYAGQNKALLARQEELSAALAQKERTIDEKTEEIEGLQTRLADTLLPEEQWTKNGFKKKNGVYLIDTREQLETLRGLLREGSEIEPGVPAATAAYRLRNDLNLDSDRWFCLGTKEHPFGGAFDGDGHTIWGRFAHENAMNAGEELFHLDGAAKVKNLQIENAGSDGEIYAGISENRDCQELESHLPGVSGCSVHLEVGEWGLDVDQAARTLRRYWEESDRQDGFYVSMTYHPDMFKEDEKPADAQKYISGMEEALCALAGAEYTERMKEAMAQEEGYLWFVKLEQIGELTCCIFEIDEPEDSPDTYEYYDEAAGGFVHTNVGYYVAPEGKWEGKQVSGQCFRIPYVLNAMHSIGIWAGCTGCEIKAADFNFDGKQDLLIHEGASSGMNGSCYRALVWKAEAGQFAYFPSFPSNVFLLQFDRQRVVDRGEVGGTKEFIDIYEIVDGEYRWTRGLVCEFQPSGKYELSYYEMGELVETHILSDADERELLYPDMNYWFQG